EVLDAVSGFVWGPWLLIPLLLLTGLYLTIRLGGLQFTKLIPALALGIIKRKDPGSKGDISQFQALTTALAATVGTGNIVAWLRPSVSVVPALYFGCGSPACWAWLPNMPKRSEGYALEAPILPGRNPAGRRIIFSAVFVAPSAKSWR